MSRLVLAALCAVICTLASRFAFANAAASSFRHPDAAGGAFTVGQTNLVVEHETLTLDCDGRGDDDASCRFEAIYDVTNPTDATEEVLGAFFGATHDEMTITVDGADVRRALSPEERAAATTSVEKVDERPEVDKAARLTGFVLRVAAMEKKSIRYAGRLDPTYTQNRRGGYDLSAIQTRHPLLATAPGLPRRFELTYLVSPLRTWRGRPAIDITVRAPSAWQFSSHRPGWSITTRDGGRRVAKLVTNAADMGTLVVGFTIAPTSVVFGGVFGGVGPELETAGPRWRAGASIGVYDWMILSLAYETLDDRRRTHYTIVPTIEAASPSFIFIFPSLALGVGVPVQLHSSGSPSVGARAQLAMSFPLVSILVPLDVYFDDGARAQLAFLTQIGF